MHSLGVAWLSSSTALSIAAHQWQHQHHPALKDLQHLPRQLCSAHIRMLHSTTFFRRTFAAQPTLRRLAMGQRCTAQGHQEITWREKSRHQVQDLVAHTPRQLSQA